MIEPNKNCSKCKRLKKFRDINIKKYPNWFNGAVLSIINKNFTVIEESTSDINDDELIRISNSIISNFSNNDKFNDEAYEITSEDKIYLAKVLKYITLYTEKIIKLYDTAEQSGERFVSNWDQLQVSEKKNRIDKIKKRLSTQINTLDNGLTSDQVLQEISACRHPARLLHLSK